MVVIVAVIMGVAVAVVVALLALALAAHRLQVVVHQRIGELHLVGPVEALEEVAAQLLPGQVVPAFVQLGAQVVPELLQALEAVAHLPGELVVEVGEGALADLAGADGEVGPRAGEVLVGQVLAVLEPDLALGPRLDADQGLLELGARRVVVADEEVALLVAVADDRHAALVEALQVGDEHVAAGQAALDGALRRMLPLQLLELLLHLVVGDPVGEARRLQALVALHLDLGPDVDAGGEAQAAALALVEAGDARGARRPQARLLRRLAHDLGEQVLDDAAADRRAVALLDEPEGNLALAEAGDLQALLVAPQGALHLPVDALGRHLDIEVARPAAGLSYGRFQGRHFRAKGGTRTPKPRRAPDPKSGAYASSATFAKPRSVQQRKHRVRTPPGASLHSRANIPDRLSRIKIPGASTGPCGG